MSFEMKFTDLEWHLENASSQNYTGTHIKDSKALMKVDYEEGIHARGKKLQPGNIKALLKNDAI